MKTTKRTATQAELLRAKRILGAQRARKKRMQNMEDARKHMAKLWGVDPEEVMITREVAELLDISPQFVPHKADSWGVSRGNVRGINLYLRRDVEQGLLREEERLREILEQQRSKGKC